MRRVRSATNNARAHRFQAEASASGRLPGCAADARGRKTELGVQLSAFVLCGLPIQKPPKEDTVYERGNRNFVLQITGHPDYGLPFGQDSIVPIYLATLAVRQRSQTAANRRLMVDEA